MDGVKNFAKVTVSTGYDASATSIVLSSGHGAKLPDPTTANFNLVWWNFTDYPDPSDDPNVEIVRCTAKSTDTLTVTRGQEGISASTKNTSGKTYKMILGVTAKMITDIAAAIPSGNFPIIRTKSANEDIQNSSTLQDDDHLSFPGEANATYVIKVQSILRSLTGSNGGFKCSFNAPTGAAIEIGILAVFMDPTTHVTAGYNSGIDAYVTGTQSGSGGTSEGSALVTAQVIMGSTAGTIQFRFAQASADNAGAIRHNKGSQLIAVKQ